MNDGSTMTIDLDTARSTAAESRGVILHEFGHALGLIHEFQRPEPAGCDHSFKTNEAITHFAKLNGWSRTIAERQIAPRPSGRTDDSGRIDLDSIMMYQLPANILWGDVNDECFLATRANKLSDEDREVIRQAYPFPPSRTTTVSP